MPIIKKPFSLSPLNDNPAVISSVETDNLSVVGGFSHKGGFPTIKFSIPPQPSMLEIASLRLCGQILVNKSDGKVLQADNSSNEYSNGVVGAGGVVGSIENNNHQMIPQTALNLNCWGGVKNVIDKVVIQSKKSLIELTSVNNYGGYTALTEAYANNADDYLISPLTASLSGGTEAQHLNRRLLSVSGATTAAGMSSLSGGANDRMIGQFFSIPIQVDLLGEQNLFLDDDFLGGLLITVHLASDSAMFCNKFSRAGATANGANDMSGFNYVLKNIKLEGKYLVPDQQDIANMSPQMNLDSRLNLINDIHSSVNGNAYTPQLQSVKSISNVFLDNDQTNTFTKSQVNYRRPVGLRSYQQARNGLRFPYNYETIAKPNHESISENGAGTWGEKTLNFPALAVGDAEVRKQFEYSLLNGGHPYHSSASLATTNAALTQDIDDAAIAGANELKNDNTICDIVGVGVDYSLGIGMTQNFVNQDYNLTLKSAVNTGNAAVSALRNGGTNSNPLLEQSFIRYNAQFDTQNLVKVI